MAREKKTDEEKRRDYDVSLLEARRKRIVEMYDIKTKSHVPKGKPETKPKCRPIKK